MAALVSWLSSGKDLRCACALLLAFTRHLFPARPCSPGRAAQPYAFHASLPGTLANEMFVQAGNAYTVTQPFRCPKPQKPQFLPKLSSRQFTLQVSFSGSLKPCNWRPAGPDMSAPGMLAAINSARRKAWPASTTSPGAPEWQLQEPAIPIAVTAVRAAAQTGDREAVRAALQQQLPALQPTPLAVAQVGAPKASRCWQHTHMRYFLLLCCSIWSTLGSRRRVCAVRALDVQALQCGSLH